MRISDWSSDVCSSDLAKSRTTIGYGAGEHIRAMMHKALGADRADNMLARITPPTRSNKLEMLKWMEAKEISRIVENEHPQIMALVLAHLDPPVAAEVLQLQIGRAHV